MYNATNTCKFALCNNCYLARSEKNPTKRQRAVLIRSKNSCNHRILELFTQGNYFHPEYIKKRLDKGDIFPMACEKCKRTFTNNGRIAAI